MQGRWFILAALVIGILVSPTPAQTSIPIHELDTIRNVAYMDGPDADPVRHKLDLHLPKDCKDFPVVFFIHGGGWVKGNKDHFGIHTLVARALARHGIGMVCPNYRLSPQVKHPEHIRDVARAFAWTHRNISKYGGNPNQLFVSGHSAGGHLCSLLATDVSYLKAEGVEPKVIRGVIPISGVFIVPPEKVLDPVFGKDPAVRRQASPITHARPDCPPFLIFYADNDIPSCDRPGAQAFFKALEEQRCTTRICEIAPRNHLSIFWNATKESDPVLRDLLSFVTAQVLMDRLLTDCPRGIDELGMCVARFASIAK